jgi:chemotaxis methyl-accepting protein methylase
MEFPHLRYIPTLDQTVVQERLEKLLVPGPLNDNDLNGRIVRLEERFSLYAALSPHGLWAPGLVVTPEMRRASELYLPQEEIGCACRRLLVLSLKTSPFLPAARLHPLPSWLDLLHRLQPLVREANPARLLRRLMGDYEFRCRFLFSLFLPRHYGGGFDRYPKQAAFLRNRLTEAKPPGVIRCLDAACGSGEGTYDLALLLRKCGCIPEKITVHGATIEPLELFAAAHGWFPHDPARQAAFRRRIGRLFADAPADHIAFFQEDLTGNRNCEGKGYDVILCNGLLGGPLLNGREELERVVGGLCARLKPGGILLAADRFHQGWKRGVPDDLLREMLAGCGLKVLAAGEGVAGVRQGLGTRDW